MDRRARRHRQTAAEIVDAAEEIVLASDLGALTVQRIAEGVGVTPGALYRYFPSRDAIVAAVQLRVIGALARAVDEATDRAGTEPLRRLAAAAGAVLAFARTEPQRYGLLARMLATPQVLVGDAEASEVLPVALAAVDRLRGDFAAARAAGALGPGDDDLRLAAWWAAIHGAIGLGKLARFDPTAARIAPEALRALLVGWGAPPEAAHLALTALEPEDRP